ncbi:NUDIX hydrolase domain-like protein [Xylariaceae sp. FL0255]|nr:NUDIX hydrolase domain-like protein [Xylariaceae sp. FL0255]
MKSTTQSDTAAAATAPTAFAIDPSINKFSVTRKEHLAAHPDLDSICVGAFVFNDSGKLLLVQRAAHDSMPLMWEVPGGGCDEEDATVIFSAVRELWEEAGLRATLVKGLVGPGHEFFTRRGLRVRKYSFLMEAGDYNVKLDPNEHQAYFWVTEEEARARKCGDTVMVYTDDNKDDHTTFDGILEAFKMRAHA